MNKQLNKVVALMDYLLDVAKIQKGRLELEKTSFNMNVLVKEVVATLQMVSKTHNIIQKGKIKREIYADRDRLGQVLTNLITNAIKYSPGEKDVFVTSVEDARGLTISVKDFGIGISKAELPRIFGRFYRASGAMDKQIEGVGLGLYVAQQIIKAHKGKMWLESIENEGSTFSFSVPRKKLR